MRNKGNTEKILREKLSKGKKTQTTHKQTLFPWDSQTCWKNQDLTDFINASRVGANYNGIGGSDDDKTIAVIPCF